MIFLLIMPLFPSMGNPTVTLSWVCIEKIYIGVFTDVVASVQYAPPAMQLPL